MMLTSIKKVNVPVLWDSNGNFQNGDLFSISVDSIIGGYTPRYASPIIPGFLQVIEFVNTLKVKDPNYGELYLTLTLEEYLALIGETSVSPGDTEVYTWYGDDEVPAGCSIVDPRLANISIISISKSGSAIYEPRWTYTNGDPDGTLDLTGAGCLAAGEAIQIIFKRI